MQVEAVNCLFLHFKGEHDDKSFLTFRRHFDLIPCQQYRGRCGTQCDTRAVEQRVQHGHNQGA